MNLDVIKISDRGEIRVLPAMKFDDLNVIIRGRISKIAQIHDEEWIDSKIMVDPMAIIESLKGMKKPPDVFTFIQKLPDVKPKYPYNFILGNVAAVQVESFKKWFEKQIDRSVRKHIRKAQREGIVATEVPFDDKLIEGIWSIYNESKIRQGKVFWHYGKSINQVKNENSTYLERSIFIGAYFNKELVGFIKFVVDENVATIMQILSKVKYFPKRVNNALLAKAVEVCEKKKIEYLIYGEHTYGRKTKSSLITFKEKNGFHKIDFPKYYVPITIKGKFIVKTGIYKGLIDLLPNYLINILVYLRSKYYSCKSYIKRI